MHRNMGKHNQTSKSSQWKPLPLSKQKPDITKNLQSPGEKSSPKVFKDEEDFSCQEPKSDAPLAKDFDQRVRPFIDLIDKLRAFGLDQDVHLPAVAVIGDQSAGKSSTLEAISGIQLPRGSGIVTRCPLVLRLKSIPADEEWRANIFYTDCNGKHHSSEIHSPEHVGDAVVLAQNRIAGENKGISKELITVDVSSSEVPDLTLIDLPGITRVPVEDQPADIYEQITSLVQKRIEQQETIILTVVPANVDITTTEALQIAKKCDPEGERTLGVITKPDLIDKGTESDLIAVVTNNKCPLKKGYTVVKCRSQHMIKTNQTLSEALQAEMNFFEKQPHFQDVDPSLLGIKHLSAKLSHELVEQIKKTVPILKREVCEKILDTKQKLSRLGRGLPTNKAQKTLFLVEILNSFGDRMKEICQGEYGNSDSKREYRLFTQARECFKELLQAIADETPKDNDAAFMEKIIRETERNRGNELPRFINYKVCQNLIRNRIDKNRKHATACLDTVDHMVNTTIVSVAQDEFAQFPGLCGEVKCKINQLRTSANECCQERIEEIFEMEKLVFTQDRIYNHDLDVVKEKQRKHDEGSGSKKPGVVAAVTQHIVEKLAFDHQITNRNGLEDMDEDVKRQEAKDMFHMIKAYLEVSARRMVDLVPLTIQLHLMKKLSENIRLNISAMMADSDTLDLIREEETVVRDRETLQKKLDRLEKAENELFKV